MSPAFNLRPSPDVLVDLEVRGSACCVWQDGLRSYVLSAAHVIESTQEGEGRQWFDGVQAGLGLTVAPELYWLHVAGGRLDAGLASIRISGPFGSPFGYPWAGQVMTWNEIDSIRSVRICGRSGEVFATFQNKVQPGRQFDGIPHRYGRLLRFRYDFKQTLKGDSGAPVISLPEGKLVGMHVAASADRMFSFAVAAIDILETFAARLPGFRLRP